MSCCIWPEFGRETAEEFAVTYSLEELGLEAIDVLDAPIDPPAVRGRGIDEPLGRF